MTRHRSPILRVAALAFAGAMLFASCGSSGGDDSSSGSDTGSKELSGVDLTVGSKDFTENILLGQMLIQALEAKGANVTDQTNLGGTQVNRKALLSGDIDVYPAYNGTGWTEHLGQENPSDDPDTLTKQVREKDLKENNIAWVGQSPFNDTYGFAANGDLAKKEDGFDLQSMADYLKANPDATLCLESEFPDRSDGLVLFEDATGYQVPQDQIQILDTGLIYTQTDQGDCDFGEIFTTDGRLDALNLDLVKDNGVFIIYNASYSWRDDVYQQHKDVYSDVIDQIFAPLDNAKMAELDAQVDVEGKDAKDVAASYLQEIGLT